MHFKGMDKVGDLAVLNVLFVLSCLPVVTVGAASAALCSAIARMRRDEGTTVRNYWRAFKAEFRQATVIWLILLAVGTLLAVNFRIITAWSGAMHDVSFVLFTAAAYVVLATAVVVFQLLARFDNTTGQMLKNALVLVFACPGRSFAGAAVFAAPAVLAVLLPRLFLVCSVLWLMLLFAASALLVQVLFEPIFQRLRRE